MKVTGEYTASLPLVPAQSSREAASVEDFQSTLNKALASSDDARLKDACREFEAIFLKQLFARMRATVIQSGLLDGGLPEEIFRDMLDEAVAGEAVKGEGVGLAAEMYKYFRRMAEMK